jgi:hypothetical protein
MGRSRKSFVHIVKSYSIKIIKSLFRTHTQFGQMVCFVWVLKQNENCRNGHKNVLRHFQVKIHSEQTCLPVWSIVTLNY